MTALEVNAGANKSSNENSIPHESSTFSINFLAKEEDEEKEEIKQTQMTNQSSKLCYCVSNG
ncbi:hypothetical protein HK100_001288, partial [Physocladia obscura]